MADGGASSMIMLITALLISGGASAILIGQWSETVRTLQQQERAADLEHEVGVSIAGDLAMVNFVGSTNTMTLYFVNTGDHDLSTTDYEILVNGVTPTSKSETVLPSGTDWSPSLLLEVELVTSSGFSNGDDVSIYFAGQSVAVNGNVEPVVTAQEVRLNVV